MGHTNIITSDMVEFLSQFSKHQLNVFMELLTTRETTGNIIIAQSEINILDKSWPYDLRSSNEDFHVLEVTKDKFIMNPYKFPVASKKQQEKAKKIWSSLEKEYQTYLKLKQKFKKAVKES